MSRINPKLLDDLKKWHIGERPKFQFVKYVSGGDSAITNATLRRLMYDIHCEDIEGEMYTVMFSAKSFYSNMRSYFTEIAGYYNYHPTDEDTVFDIIKHISSIATWLTLIITDIDEMSDQPDALNEMTAALYTFSARMASVIITGNDEYQQVFSSAKSALKLMERAIAAKPEDAVSMIGLYDNSNKNEIAEECFSSSDEKKDALEFYWNTLLGQYKNKSFDSHFSSAFSRKHGSILYLM